MKWLKRLLFLIVALFIIIAICAWVYIGGLKPDYNEERALSGLQSDTEVFYDDYGIPHIYADHNVDAYRTLGYIHAKDRLWQMEVIRRIAPGRLSELFGQATVDTDIFFRHLQIAQSTNQAVKHYQATASDELKNIVNAYLSGVNDFVATDQKPIEYTLLGIEKTPFDIYDIHNVMGYMAFSFAVAHKTDPIVSYIGSELGADYLKALDVHVDTSTTMIDSYLAPDLTESLSMNAYEALQGLPHPQLIGSNSWVIAGSKTKSGEVIFANDPHIGFAQPAVWYEAHIETPDLSIYGNYLAGFPFAQVGHTKDWAVGLTMYENDDIDFYQEQTDDSKPNQYYHKGEWKDMTVEQSSIKVKDGADVELNLRSTVHGPIISTETKGFNKGEAISMWWTYLHRDVDLLRATHQINTANTMEDVQEAASLIAAPGLNVMYGDKDGNVAWWASAHLPIRPDHVNSKLILRGTGEDDILGFQDFMDNPMAINPSWGYVYSANNQSVRADQDNYPGYYLPEDRAQRIVQLLESNDQWDVQEVKAMLLDQTNHNSKVIGNFLGGILSDAGISDAAVTSLTDWDGNYGDESIAPIIYVKMQLNLMKDILIDELGAERFNILKTTHLIKRSYYKLFTNASHPWWDNVGTDSKESQQDIILSAYEKSLTELKAQLGDDMDSWRWSAIHTLEHPHSLGQNEMLRPYFNVGPFELTSSNEVINNMLFAIDDDGTYEVHGGPSCRRIVDFSDVSGNSWSILPTGQSGRVMSPHYKDQAEMYATGQYRRKLIKREDIEAVSENRSLFKPE